MSLGNSLAATVASRGYLAVVGIVVLPAYLQLLGPEAYGLVALFFVLQVWFQLLDLGLTSTLAREAARLKAGQLSTAEFRLLLRSLEGVFCVVALLAALLLVAGAGPVTHRWLNVEQLPADEAAASLRLIALCVALRLLSEPYRASLSGLGLQTWLAGFNALFGSLRLVLVLPVLLPVGATVTHFFQYQLALLVLEALVLAGKAYRQLPGVGSSAFTPWRLAPLKRVLGFSLTMSLASLVWMAVSQVDRLVLSGVLKLSDYGEFGIAAAAATGVSLVSAALTEVLLPRFTGLHSQGDRAATLALYRTATQWGGVAAWSVALVLAVEAERVLWVWTGNAGLATRMAPVLALYALGHAVLTVSAFPFYLQFARGQLRLHLLGTALMVTAYLPALAWGIAAHGALGAAAAWLAVNVLYFLVWTPVAHRRLEPGLHLRWLLADVLPVALAAGAAALLCDQLPWPDRRWLAGLVLLVVWAAVFLAGAAALPWVRMRFRRVPTAV